MDTRKLNYFIVLCEEMNYRRAALRLFITQPTLSQQIKQLEEDLDMTLFIREKNSITLTDAGKLLRSKAYNITKEINELRNTLNVYQEKIKKEIIIATTGSTLVLNSIYTFAKAFPDIKINVKEHSIKTIRDMLLNDEIDFAVSYLSDNEDSRLTREIMGKDSFMAVVPKNHELSKLESISVSDLENYPLILAQSGSALSRSLAHYESKTNVMLQPQYLMQNYAACLGMVRNNLGISVLPLSFLTTNYEEDYSLVPVHDLQESLNVGILYKREHAFTHEESKLIQILKEFFSFI